MDGWVGCARAVSRCADPIRSSRRQCGPPGRSAKIKTTRIPYRVPSAQDRPARAGGVLTVLYPVFHEGDLASGADTDAIRLTRARLGSWPTW